MKTSVIIDEIMNLTISDFNLLVSNIKNLEDIECETVYDVVDEIYFLSGNNPDMSAYEIIERFLI